MVGQIQLRLRLPSRHQPISTHNPKFCNGQHLHLLISQMKSSFQKKQRRGTFLTSRPSLCPRPWHLEKKNVAMFVEIGGRSRSRERRARRKTRSSGARPFSRDVGMRGRGGLGIARPPETRWSSSLLQSTIRDMAMSGPTRTTRRATTRTNSRTRPHMIPSDSTPY